MKICLCCGASCAPDAPHCLACGECSFEFAVQTPFFSGSGNAPVRLGAGDAAPSLPEEPPAPETTPEQLPLVDSAPADPTAQPAKRAPGRPKKDAVN